MVPGSYVNGIARIGKLDSGINLVQYGDEVLELGDGVRYIDEGVDFVRVAGSTKDLGKLKVVNKELLWFN